MLAAEIRRGNAYQQGTVGIAAVPGKQAHAVDRKALRLRGSSHHLTAGTHAEGIQAPAVFQMHGELVICCAKRRMAGKFPVLRPVDLPLQMLDPHTHCKGLLHKRNAGCMQQFHGITGAVAEGEHGMAAGDFMLFAIFLVLQAGQNSAFCGKARHFRTEADLPAHAFDHAAQIPDGSGQAVGADMGLGLPENFLRGTALDKGFQHKADARILDAGIELAVREGTCTAFPELDIALGHEHAVLPESRHMRLAFLDRAAAFEHNGTQPGPGKDIRCKHAAGAESDHDRPLLGMADGNAVMLFRDRADIAVFAASLQDAAFSLSPDINSCQECDRILFSGIDRTLAQPDGGDLLKWDMQLPPDHAAQGIFGIIQRQPDILNTNHHSLLYGICSVSVSPVSNRRQTVWASVCSAPVIRRMGSMR